MNSSSRQTPIAWLLTILALAVVNFIAGRICLMLAVGSGYATGAFPPAGIAMGALLIFGYRVWPGVFLGAFALGLPDSIFSASAAAASLGIASGSTLQAIVGAALVRRIVGFPTSLDDERSIGSFFVLGGPVACLIAATFGIFSLWATGLEIDDPAYRWLTWWVGDSIGVMIFAPLMLIAFGQPREVWRPRWLSVGLPVLVAFGVVIGLFNYARANAEADTRLEFNRLAMNVQRDLHGKVESCLETMNSIAGLYRSSERVTREEFRLFVERIFPRQPGIVALGWVPRVQGYQRVKFEQAVRDDAVNTTDPALRRALGKYRIRRWHGDGSWRPYNANNTSDEMFPVHFIEPFAENEAALGIDLFSNDERWDALRAAREYDQPVATPPLVTVQETGNEQSILLVVPIHPNDQPRETLEQRRKHLQGFASGVVRISNLVEASCSEADLAMIEMTLVDQTSGKALYGKQPEDDEGIADGKQKSLEHVGDLQVGGRLWRVVITPSDRFLSSAHSRRLWSELALGFLFTLAVGGSTLLVTGHSRRVEMLVDQRTHELQLARFAIDHAADAVFWINNQGRFTDVNVMACEKSGYSREELTSLCVWDVDPTFPKEAWNDHRRQLLEAGSLVFESTIKTKSGDLCPVEVSTGYLDYQGDSYECAIVRDITDRKEAENTLKSEQDFLRKLLDIHERDRRTVAYEIHDGFVQYAVGAQMQVETLRDKDEDNNKASHPLSAIASLLRKAIDEGRNLISDLRPMVIDESGIVHAIEHLAADESRRGLHVTFDHDVQFERLDWRLESTIFRIVQEALNNVKHHSQADCVDVRLTQQNGQLEVSVRDQGVGFDRNAVPDDRFGLRGIQERAILFGGRASVESSPGSGTLISVKLPLRPPTADEL